MNRNLLPPDDTTEQSTVMNRNLLPLDDTTEQSTVYEYLITKAACSTVYDKAGWPTVYE